MSATNFIKDIREAVFAVFIANTDLVGAGAVNGVGGSGGLVICCERAYIEPIAAQIMSGSIPYLGILCLGWDPDDKSLVGQTRNKVPVSCGIVVEGPAGSTADQIALQDEAAQIGAQCAKIVQGEIIASQFSLRNTEGTISEPLDGRFRFLPSPPQTPENQDAFRIYAKYDFFLEYRRDLNA